mgnify:FL=1
MNRYIGTKLIEAEPAYRVNDQVILPIGWHTSPGDKVEEGYMVRYRDGYESWSPKAVFEAAYLPLTVNPNLRTDAPSISAEMVEDFIRAVDVTTIGDKTTVVRAVLRNGFELVESSSCVSAENYDQELGASICLKKIRDKVWFLLGFLLQTAVHGI